MTTPAVAAGNTARRRGLGVVSKEARSVVWDLLDLPVPARRQVIASLGERELSFVLQETLRETGSLYGLWHDAPSGFVEDVLGETMWSLQRQIIDAIPHHKRVAVPAGFGVGKTHISARAVVWFCNVFPVGTGQAVTLAPRFRQVRNQLWPHIRRVVARSGLPGHADMVQYKIPDVHGVDTLVAYGFAAPENDESAMQGIHAQKLLLVVEEAGGIPKGVGEGTNNLLTGDARLFAIGNPPSDDPGSWFETLCEEGWDPDKPDSTTIRIGTDHSPSITGEVTPICRECVPNHDNHRIGDPGKHMPDQEWMDRTIEAYGEDHPYVVSKVFARFPKDAGVRIIPASWVENSMESEEPDGEGYVALRDLGIPEEVRQLTADLTVTLPAETDPYKVKRGAWVRLGVDVAADGGDEFAIYRAVGDMVQHRHTSSGSANSNSVTVAETILGHILAAQRLADTLSTKAPVHVKIDTIGVGWGVVGQLERWGREGKHKATIIPVNVAERPENDDEGAAMRPYLKRDELWLAGRALLQPDPHTRETRLRLRVDRSCAAQLSVPDYTASAGGFIRVESKASMKKRGRNSPDRAEAALLAVYEPGHKKRRNRGILVG